MKIQARRIVAMLFAVLIVFGLFPMRADAHRAYFMQVLIDEGSLQYVSNVIEEAPIMESDKIERKLWEYDKEVDAGLNYLLLKPDATTSIENLPFTFPSKAIKNLGIFNATNNATEKDGNRAHEIANTLTPNLNEILLIINEDKPFADIEQLISASEQLVGYINQRSELGHFFGDTQIRFTENEAIVTKGGTTYSYLIAMSKGYTVPEVEDGNTSTLYSEKFASSYSANADIITLVDMIKQANFSYVVNGHTTMDAARYGSSFVELMMVDIIASVTSGLKSLLGLREIDDLVFGKGITGSAMYYNGMMPTSWFQKSMAFHLIFQAITWITLGIAIIKLAFQRNLATISASSRISLMDGIKDLILAGFMLMGVFLTVNLMGRLNSSIVNIFSNTTGNYVGFGGQNLQMASLGGALLQLYYLLITIYLNAIYVARAISLSILIAVAPIFIGSIAFQNKNNELFETWGRMLISNVFVQAFHAFMLSFFLSIQMTATRGIELAIVSFALIPATKIFNELITKKSGGLISSTGAAVGMASAAIGVGFGATMNKAKKGGGADYKGSVGEGDSSTPSMSGTRDALANRRMNPNEGSGVAVGTMAAASSKNYKEMGRNFLISKGPGIAKNVAVGAAKVGFGTALGMAYGGLDNVNALKAGAVVGSGMGNFGKVLGDGKSALNGVAIQQEDLLGAEELSNGNLVMHRDRDLLKAKGLYSARTTEDKNLELVYDKGKLQGQNLEHINAIQQAHSVGDTDFLKSRGVAGVYDTPKGNVAVHYNEYGKERLGYSSAYTTKDKIVETKKPGQPMQSALTYDIGKPQAGVPERHMPSPDIMDGPSDGGQSLEGGSSYNLDLDDHHK